jgi:hypothetical protein
MSKAAEVSNKRPVVVVVAETDDPSVRNSIMAMGGRSRRGTQLVNLSERGGPGFMRPDILLFKS